jgi:hypothetical protein
VPIFDAAGNRLVTASQAAELLGVLPSAVSHARRVGTFPEPADWVDARTPVWREIDLDLRDPIPAALRRLPRWVCPSARKVPRQPDGTVASSTDPDTWTDYASARGAANRPVGFVLDGDGIVCVDIDHCLRVDGTPKFAAELIDWWAARTFVEVSPSGEGLHIWGCGEVPVGRRVRHDGGRFEVYGDGRYVTVTGDRYRNAPSRLSDLSPLIAALPNGG